MCGQTAYRHAAVQQTAGHVSAGRCDHQSDPRSETQGTSSVFAWCQDVGLHGRQLNKMKEYLEIPSVRFHVSPVGCN